MRKIAYLAIDVHARHCVMGDMDGSGTFRGNRTFITSETNLVNALKAIKTKKKYLVMEACPLSNWAAQIANDHVAKVIISDPRENALIYKSSKKCDKVDTKKLCRLLRLGELKEVYRPENDQRAIFKAAAQHYLDLRHQLIALKQKIKAMYRQWGVIDVFTTAIYSGRGRDKFLKQINHHPIYLQLQRLYALLDLTETMKQSARKTMQSLGCRYPEIKEFEKMPGMGPIGAHIFDAYIQTPHRFAKRSRLWKYCRLGVTDRTSDGKPLGYKRLDNSGIGELKALTYRAFISAMKGDNEVKNFYLHSLQRTHDRKHARLNTQRKIVSVMLSIWKKGTPYRAESFLDPSIAGC
jgi:transposase